MLVFISTVECASAAGFFFKMRVVSCEFCTFYTELQIKYMKKTSQFYCLCILVWSDFFKEKKCDPFHVVPNRYLLIVLIELI